MENLQKGDLVHIPQGAIIKDAIPSFQDPKWDTIMPLRTLDFPIVGIYIEPYDRRHCMIMIDNKKRLIRNKSVYKLEKRNDNEVDRDIQPRIGV